MYSNTRVLPCLLIVVYDIPNRWIKDVIDRTKVEAWLYFRISPSSEFRIAFFGGMRQ